jgi:cysteinyl-tRNA synthetase
MTVKMYNTFTKSKSEFKPIEPGKVKMYVCGPTVYDLLHIGNFRGPIFFNLVRNWLEKCDYDVTYVYNFTDVDDKIINRANDEGVDSLVVSEKYIKEFKDDFKRLGLRDHDFNPKVTDYIPQIISFIEDLIKNNKAYEVDGEIFYRIDHFEAYGALSGKKIDDLNSGHRVEVDQRKINPHDFVLWKPSKVNEPSWDSPWGKGRPGWHIECSAMIQAILGPTIDIHGGGIDLIFPHHENEIAQGEGRTGCKYCNYWMHNNFINLNEEKMSKSIGNVIKARHFMDKYHPEILKYLFLSVHYRSLLNIADDRIGQVIVALKRVYSALNEANIVMKKEVEEGEVDKSFKTILTEADKSITLALNDDFNTADYIAQIFEVVRAFNSLRLSSKKITPAAKATAKAFSNWVGEYGQLAALFSEPPSEFLIKMDDLLLEQKKIDRAQVEALILSRNQARENKDFTLSDKIRDQLAEMGIELFDGQHSGRGWSVRV